MNETFAKINLKYERHFHGKLVGFPSQVDQKNLKEKRIFFFLNFLKVSIHPHMLFKCHFHEKFKNSVIEKPESEKKFVPLKNHQNIKF